MNKLWQPTKGVFTIGRRNIKTGVMRDVSLGLNTVVYEGLDILGRLLAGADVKINVVYMEFVNGGTPPVVVVDPAAGRSYYAALEAVPQTKDYIRVPLVGSPQTSASNVDFVSNKVTFVSLSADALAGRGGQPFNNASDSKVFGIALVAAADVNDASQDKVFARSYDFTPKTKLLGEEISIVWSQIFGESMISSS